MDKDNEIVLRVAAKAVITNNKGQVLIARESTKDSDNTKVGRYGLVGGRLNIGESFEDGLRREVSEEVGLEIEIIKPLQIGEWRPVIKEVPYQIIAVFMLCKSSTDNFVLSDEHDDAQWIDSGNRHNFDIMEPDCFVIDLVKEL